MLKDCVCAIFNLDDIIKMSKNTSSKPKKQQRASVSNFSLLVYIYLSKFAEVYEYLI